MVLRKCVFEDVDICIDNGYVNVGRKFKVKEMCDKFIDDEFVNLVIDWFCVNRFNFSRLILYVWDSI